MELRLHDSRTGAARPFVPRDPDRVKMYVCGPTVYADIHIGNARPLAVFDLLYRLLRHGGRRVDYVRNVTDIDDKIIAAAAAAGTSPAAHAERCATAFADAAAGLGCLEPTREPRATGHIADMIELAAKLLEKGHAYEAEGHVLFAVGSWDGYGGLAGRSRDEMIAGARVEVAAYKKDPADFVLWKPAPAAEPGWDSPWGRGRPGWHLECSAMIEACLGGGLDIHGGGADLLFPHHENENAQSCCAFGGDSLANWWMHNGHVTIHGAKMAKSAGNVLSLKELLAAQPGEAVRYALLGAHYRSPLDWRPDTLPAARQALDRLYRSLGDGGQDAAEAEPPAAVMERPSRICTASPSASTKRTAPRASSCAPSCGRPAASWACLKPRRRRGSGRGPAPAWTRRRSKSWSRRGRRRAAAATTPPPTRSASASRPRACCSRTARRGRRGSGPAEPGGARRPRRAARLPAAAGAVAGRLLPLPSDLLAVRPRSGRAPRRAAGPVADRPPPGALPPVVRRRRRSGAAALSLA